VSDVYEPVHMIWDLYDGIRTGVADFCHAPHYFASLYDETDEAYSDNFRLYPVDDVFMEHARRNWVMYRAWERRFHAGEVPLDTHPGGGGVNPEYDANKSWLEERLSGLRALPGLYRARFRTLPGQGSLPIGILRDTEVAWSLSPR